MIQLGRVITHTLQQMTFIILAIVTTVVRMYT